MKSLEEMIKELPPDLRQEVQDFVDSCPWVLLGDYVISLKDGSGFMPRYYHG